MEQSKAEKTVNNSREHLNPGRPFPEPEVKPTIQTPPPVDQTVGDTGGSANGSSGN